MLLIILAPGFPFWMLRMMKHFNYLVALAREQHFGRAAESCNVS